MAELSRSNFHPSLIGSVLLTPFLQVSLTAAAAPHILIMNTLRVKNGEAMERQPIRTFDIALVQARVADCRDNDSQINPRRNVLVLRQEMEQHGGLASYIHKIESGAIQTEPLIIRANTGESVDIRLLNFTGEPIDTPLTKRLYTGTKPHAIPLHGHVDAWRGAAGALLVEEAGATFHDAQTGEDLLSGTNAVIRRADGTAFREFVLLVQDACLNGRSEPMAKRLDKQKDSAYCFSSILHGDPDTPRFETYPGEELMIRLLSDDDDENYSFHLAGMPINEDSADTSIHITQPYAPGDYLYYFGGTDGIRLGLWGLIRTYSHPVRKLPVLNRDRYPVFAPLPQPNDTACIRSYEFAAVQRRAPGLRRNVPEKRLIIPFSDVSRARHRTYHPEHPVLEAQAGDWIRITLHNLLPPSSSRVFLSPQSFSYDPVFHAGMNIGRNPWEQTVKPGERRTYLWHADRTLTDDKAKLNFFFL